MNSQAALGRATAVAAAGTALSRATGFVRLAALAYALGIAETRLADTYTLANTAPNIMYQLALGGVLSGVLLRVFVEVRDREGEDEAWLFITRCTKAALLFLTVVVLIGIVASPYIFRAYAFRVSEEERAAQWEVGSALLILFVPQIVFYGLNTISTGVLRAQRRFAVITFAPVLNNLVVTAAFVAFALVVPSGERTLREVPWTGLLILGLGTTAGIALLGLIPYVYARKIGMKWVRRSGLRDTRFGYLLRLSAYTIGYAGVNQVGLWVIIALANQVQGGVAARDAAFVFFQLPHGLLAVSISLVLGPSLTESAVAEDLAALGHRFIRGMRAIAFLILPAVAGYLAVAPEIIRLLLEHGFTTSSSTDLIASVLRAYAGGLLFFSWWHLMLGTFQSLGDTRTPFFINLVSLCVLATTAILLFSVLHDPRLRVAGLAIAHAASYVIATIAGFVILRRKARGFDTRSLVVTIAKTATAAVAAGGSAWTAARVAGSILGTDAVSTQLLQVALSVGAGVLVYAAAARAMGMEELHWLRSALAQRAT